MFYSLILTVMTMTGSHSFVSTKTFATAEACAAYGEDTRATIAGGAYVLSTRVRCKLKGIPRSEQ